MEGDKIYAKHLKNINKKKIFLKIYNFLIIQKIVNLNFTNI